MPINAKWLLDMCFKFMDWHCRLPLVPHTYLLVLHARSYLVVVVWVKFDRLNSSASIIGITFLTSTKFKGGFVLFVNAPEQYLTVVASTHIVLWFLRIPVKEALREGLIARYNFANLGIQKLDFRVPSGKQDVLVKLLIPLDLEG